MAGTPPPGPTTPTAQPMTAMGGEGSSVPWRGDGIRYNSNEIYLDLIEEVDAVIDRWAGSGGEWGKGVRRGCRGVKGGRGGEMSENSEILTILLLYS